jgi:hypothetical protein
VRPVRRLAALIVWGLLWGLVVETVDRLLGDPFEPLDVFTLAVQVMLAIALWPLFKRVWGSGAEQA